MNRRIKKVRLMPQICAIGTTVLSLVTIGTFSCNPGASASRVEIIKRQPKLFPDYSGITIPSNIAPLNFLIMEPGSRFKVTIRSFRGRPVEISTVKPAIVIPEKLWRVFIESNKGRPVIFEISAFSEKKGWRRFEPVVDSVAEEPIDPFLVYRKINICIKWINMGIFERCTESYAERPLLSSHDVEGACMNCHSFRRNDPDDMLLQIRSRDLGTPMLLRRLKDPIGGFRAIDTKTGLCSGKVGFTAWHPTRELIAFSINGFTMLYHTAAQEVRDVYDRSADLALYNAESATVSSTAAIARPDRLETMPEWSPDGRYLYFCSSPQVPANDYDKVLCDLMRIPFDDRTGSWGAPDTVLSAQTAGGSITQPRISPDGRFCAFTVSPYSDFPIHQARSGLHILTLATGAFRKLDSSNVSCEAWHSWSGNGRWIVFTSKRLDRRFARTFICHVDKNGVPGKPFVLPQKNPSYYRSSILSSTIPELISGPVKGNRRDLARALLKKRKSVSVDAQTGATAPEKPHPANDIE